MRKLVALFASVAVVLAVASGVALAQTQYPTQPTQPSTQPGTAPAQTAPGSSGQMPKVSSLKPFSVEADYMSLPGYLRYLMHQQTGQWMTYAEATRAVQQGQ